MPEPSAISISSLGKTYRVWNSPEARLTSALWRTLGQKHRAESKYRDFHALSDISLDVHKGECLGIIGLNGSGKSTLLQIIAGTLRPTQGELTVQGRVAALLELGAGFNPEFTGRENVYLNAAVLGLSRDETAAKFPEIEAFADIGDFIDQPVKTFSSGMFVRLAFAVLTQVKPDILIIDEALSVGDFLFQQKCFDCIRDFKKRGCTFLFVSHGMGTVLELCDRAIVLDGGRAIFQGSAKAAVDLYEAHSLRTRFGISRATPPPPTAPVSIPEPAAPELTEDGARAEKGAVDQLSEMAVPLEPSITHENVELVGVRLLDTRGQEKKFLKSGETTSIEIAFRFCSSVRDPHVGFKLRNRLGVVLYETNTYCLGLSPGRVEDGETLVCTFHVPVYLIDGEYSITVGLANGGRDRAEFDEALHFQHDVTHFVVTRDWSRPHWSGLIDLQATVTSTRQSSRALSS
jgi:lipopolysaccharide transport system ATP-binding protein